MARSTQAEKEARIAVIYKHLANGWSRAQIVEYTSESWQLGTRQTDTLIAQARTRLADDCQMDRHQFLAECLQRLRNVEQQAMKRGQLMTAVTAIEKQCRLVGLLQ